MTQATVMDLQAQEPFKIIKGTLQIFIRLVQHGGLGNCGLVGMIPLVDLPHLDSAETIRHCDEMDVDVKVVTGDQQIVAKEVPHRLGMGRVIMDASYLVDAGKSDREVTGLCIRAGGLAQVIPEHKYRIVKLLQNRDIVAGMTRDDVNDVPVLKKANVGIAVNGRTDATHPTADIVLLAPGLSTIVDGLTTSHANAFLCPY
ncbi:hypothetical protein BGX20_007690 [Mortierella sp. AD010]|nr:hypothetical protein BGX20_007690 [Mortierella sp. AD010]